MKIELQERPTKAQIAEMPPFPGLPPERIYLLKTPAEFEAARDAIRSARFVGFDTESKPTFTADAVRDGPHVVQFALPDRAYIIQTNDKDAFAASPARGFLQEVLESREIVKVGFGLKSDRGPLHRKFGLELKTTVELTQVLRQLRYRNALGLKAAVAIVLGQNLRKSKSVTTSNWAATRLSPSQLLYAANDAYASLAIFRAMGSPWPGGDQG